MRWLKRAINRWLSENILSTERSPDRNSLGASPIYNHGSAATLFNVIRAANGTIIQTYDYANDRPSFWVVPEGTSIGEMVDTAIVEKRLSK